MRLSLPLDVRHGQKEIMVNLAVAQLSGERLVVAFMEEQKVLGLLEITLMR